MWVCGGVMGVGEVFACMREWNPGTVPKTFVLEACPGVLRPRAIKVCSEPGPGPAPYRNPGGIFGVCVRGLGGALLYPNHSLQSPMCCQTGFAPDLALGKNLPPGYPEFQGPPC